MLKFKLSIIFFIISFLSLLLSFISELFLVFHFIFFILAIIFLLRNKKKIKNEIEAKYNSKDVVEKIESVGKSIIIRPKHFLEFDFKHREQEELIINKILNINSNFPVDNIKFIANYYFQEFYRTLNLQNLNVVNNFLTDNMLNKFYQKLEEKKVNGRIIENISVLDCIIDDFKKIDDKYFFGLKLIIKANDYIVINGNECSKNDNLVVSTYFMELLCDKEALINYCNNIVSTNCPNCGAPNNVEFIRKCENCGEFIMTNINIFLLNELNYWDEV